MSVTGANVLFYEPRFDALRNALYHTQRRAFFDMLNRLMNFLVIIAGASVVGKVAESLRFDSIWLELGVVLLATAQLVFDFGKLAREHEFLQRRYYEVLAEMDAEAPADLEAAKKRWSAKLLTIAADEPMLMRALDAVAYNQALDAMHEGEIQQQFRLHVSALQYLLRNFRAFHRTNFQSQSRSPTQS